MILDFTFIVVMLSSLSYYYCWLWRFACDCCVVCICRFISTVWGLIVCDYYMRVPSESISEAVSGGVYCVRVCNHRD